MFRAYGTYISIKYGLIIHFCFKKPKKGTFPFCYSYNNVWGVYSPYDPLLKKWRLQQIFCHQRVSGGYLVEWEGVIWAVKTPHTLL